MIDERLAVYLDVMKDASAHAMAFVEGLSKDEFLRDEKTKAAVAMCFIRIGEGTARIEQRLPDFIAGHPDWPWNEIRAMRNRSAHDYEQLNFDTIWVTLHTSVPRLYALIDALGPLDPRDHSGS
ncbi:MAG: hypothetical protein BGO82_18955 [Devosia sp. 67-54]|uniref:HepT-like ribonuclease domain-containing protein n=1 Tax=unclassified Devosia TaxID=196773 RepID=UPI0009593487|nr:MULTISPECIES: HepT-like ribonuclease domain-containing protein [unclassified Devosia]MBN9306171.1 DUF86 domain-containing protein [Devosia sp.]OJX18252.1 MAG: hypothetical protein BGO82_18955 [Devosia sp. 67-54]